MAQKILVEFACEDSGVEELTWGQRAHWGAMQASGTTEPAGGMMPLDEGTTVENIVTLLRFIMSRHQALRTRLRSDPDGTPKQVVAASGEIGLEVVDAADDDDPAAVADAVRIRYETSHWDLAEEWPVRMAVIRHRGIAAYFVAIYANIFIDGYGIDALVADLANLDYSTGQALAPVAGTPSLEQARLQRTPEVLRLGNASLRKWERHLHAVAPQRFGESPDPREPRYWEAVYLSPASQLALPVLADRTRVHSSAILLAAYAVSLVRIGGSNPSVVRMLVSNRFRPGFAESVSNLAQSALCVIDVAECTFDEAVARAFKSQMSAGLHGYYDPPQLWDLIDRVNKERGVELDLMCYFNDRRRGLAHTNAGPTASADQIRSALPLGELRWGKRWDTPDATCYLHVDIVKDAVEYKMFVDTHRVPVAGLEACLLGIEAVIVDAALEPATMTEVHRS